jgi:hypothetical protein
VSVISEDWRWRMVTPLKGDFANIPVNEQAKKIGREWDPDKDQAAGEACRSYGAPAIMRVPGRVRISWQDEDTLKIETDAGTQTRLLRFPSRAHGVRQSRVARVFDGAMGAARERRLSRRRRLQ